MQKSIAGIIFCLSLANVIQAADEISIERKSLATFPHKQHQKNLGGCTDCHGTKVPGPIPEFDNKWVHATCAGCHRENKAGPIACNGCHEY